MYPGPPKEIKMSYTMWAICERCAKKTETPVTFIATGDTVTLLKPYITVTCGNKSGDLCKECYTEYISTAELAATTYRAAYKTALDRFNASKATAQTQYDNALNSFWGGAGNEIETRR